MVGRSIARSGIIIGRTKFYQTYLRKEKERGDYARKIRSAN